MFGATGALGGYGASQVMEAPEKKARQEDKQTCMPATVRLLLDSHAAGEGKGEELQLHGTECANVTLVGVVENLVQQATMLEFTINDASGRVKVRHYQNSEATEKVGLVNGRYASVVGSLRTSPAVHVSALTLRAVTNADEVSYHMVEVAHAALMMKSGGSSAPAAAPASMQAPIKAAAPVAAAFAAPAAAAPGDVRAAVLAVLKAENDARPEGIPLAVVLSKLSSSPAAGVKAALQSLVTDGEAFTTIDDDHFSPI